MEFPFNSAEFHAPKIFTELKGFQDVLKFVKVDEGVKCNMNCESPCRFEKVLEI